jgi:hypothetical protein
MTYRHSIIIVENATYYQPIHKPSVTIFSMGSTKLEKETFHEHETQYSGHLGR